MRVYLAAPLRAGAAEPGILAAMANAVERGGHVLASRRLLDPDPLGAERGMPDRAIFERDFAEMQSADLLLAEVSTPSHGVGWELAWFLAKGRVAIACCSRAARPRLSAMIAGNPSPWQRVVIYADAADLETQVLALVSR